jgi:hypothetical protein
MSTTAISGFDGMAAAPMTIGERLSALLNTQMALFLFVLVVIAAQACMYVYADRIGLAVTKELSNQANHGAQSCDGGSSDIVFASPNSGAGPMMHAYNILVLPFASKLLTQNAWDGTSIVVKAAFTLQSLALFRDYGERKKYTHVLLGGMLLKVIDVVREVPDNTTTNSNAMIKRLPTPPSIVLKLGRFDGTSRYGIPNLKDLNIPIDTSTGVPKFIAEATMQDTAGTVMCVVLAFAWRT